jgi:hypothetical protein
MAEEDDYEGGEYDGDALGQEVRGGKRGITK